MNIFVNKISIEPTTFISIENEIEIKIDLYNKNLSEEILFCDSKVIFIIDKNN